MPTATSLSSSCYTRRRLIAVVAAVTLATTLSACGSSKKSGGGRSGGDKPVTLRFADVANPGQPLSVAGLAFVDYIKKNSKSITIKYFSQSKLGDETSLVSQERSASVDITDITTQTWSSTDKSVAAFSLPFLFSTVAQAKKVMVSDGARKVLDTMDGSGAHALGLVDSGFSQTVTKNPVTRLSGYKGLKVRVLPGTLPTQTMEALGANPVPVEFSQVYLALSNGTVQGSEVSATGAVGSKFYEVAKNITIDNHSWLGAIISMNKSKWQSLSSAQQKTLVAAAQAAGVASAQADQTTLATAIDTLKSHGVGINELSDLAKARDAVKSVYDKAAASIGAENVSAIESAVGS